MSPTYALAEVGASIILAAYSPNATATTASGASTGTGGGAAAATSKASSGISTKLFAAGAWQWAAGLLLPLVVSSLLL
jgi:hypothetical protein